MLAAPLQCTGDGCGGTPSNGPLQKSTNTHALHLPLEAMPAATSGWWATAGKYTEGPRMGFNSPGKESIRGPSGQVPTSDEPLLVQCGISIENKPRS